MRVIDLKEAPSYDSAEHISSAVGKVVDYAKGAAKKFHAATQGARHDRQQQAKDVLNQTDVANRKQATQDAKKKKLASMADAGDGAGAIIANIIVDRDDPTDKDADTFDYFDVEDLATFQKNVGTVINTFGKFPDVLMSALKKGDILNASQKKPEAVSGFMTPPAETTKRVVARVTSAGFDAADREFWTAVLVSDDAAKTSKLATDHLRKTAAQNEKINGAASPFNKAPGAKPAVVLPAGTALITKMMVHYQLLNDRLIKLESIVREAAKRPRKDPRVDDDEITEEIKVNLRKLLKELKK